MNATVSNPAHLIKRYSGVRLYDTAAMAYVTAGQLRDMWRGGAQIIVKDAATGEDITSLVVGDNPNNDGLLRK